MGELAGTTSVDCTGATTGEDVNCEMATDAVGEFVEDNREGSTAGEEYGFDTPAVVVAEFVEGNTCEGTRVPTVLGLISVESAAPLMDCVKVKVRRAGVFVAVEIEARIEALGSSENKREL